MYNKHLNGEPRFIDTTRFQHDPRHTAVDVYTEGHLLKAENNLMQDALGLAYHNSLRYGCPDTSTIAARGKFLAMQIKIAGAKNVPKVGALNGHSSVWMVSASKDVKITIIKVNPEWTNQAEDHFRRASIDSQVSVKLGPAKDALVELSEEVKAGEQKPFDLVSIDANKDNNILYFKLVLDIVKSGMPIFVVDNVVRHGDLANEQAAKKDPRVQSARNLIEYTGKESRVEAVVMQTVSEKDYDGFMIVIVK